ncbi:gonadotropin-releasing hormone II receptor-like [Pantherophis guttatus]|uniref:Gonadotropin-releasing hormone II receptor-like n=1 Tax=Pantherophis guttatus TaxID=94885 RepID=A0A6P9DJ93_PANGU|nr:gonadotropin-releasing hormone II receptor-like [Pantherophis guttatus]
MEHNRSGLWGRGSSFKDLEKSVVLPVFSAAAQVRVGLTLLLCVISATCNMAMLWSGWTRPAAKGSHARLLLLHLAVADLLVALVVMPLDAAWNITLQWQAGDVACRLLMFLKLLAMYASAFVTTLISLDCQAAILQPLATARAWRKNQILLYAAWLMSASLSTPQLFLFHTVTISSPQNFTQCTTHGSFAQHWHEVAYNMFSFLGLFLLPLLVMSACYTRVLLEISRHVSSCNSWSAQEMPLRRSRNPIPRARLRLLHLSLAIVGSFVLCWTPYYLLGLWYWFWPADMEGTVSPSLAHILFLFGLLNACLDPITYRLFAGGWQGECCRAAGRGKQPPSPVTGSFQGSVSSARLQREGRLLLSDTAEVALGPGSRALPRASACPTGSPSSQLSRKAARPSLLQTMELPAALPGPEEEGAPAGTPLQAPWSGEEPVWP